MPRPVSATARRLWNHGPVRYLLVGGLCFLVDVALLWLSYEVLGISLPVATAIAFLASFAITYTLQRIVAFAAETKVAPSVARYTALVIFNTLTTTGIVWTVSAFGGEWLVGKIIAVTTTTVWNYFAYRHWVFATPRNRSTDV